MESQIAVGETIFFKKCGGAGVGYREYCSAQVFRAEERLYLITAYSQNGGEEISSNIETDDWEEVANFAESMHQKAITKSIQVSRMRNTQNEFYQRRMQEEQAKRNMEYLLKYRFGK